MWKKLGHLHLQASGYKAFIPAPFPLKELLTLSPKLEKKHGEAMRLIGKLDGISQLLPDKDFFLLMFFRKEAASSSQIEGTQATMIDAIEAEVIPKAAQARDVDDIIFYIRALNYGLKRIDTLPFSIRFIRELHEELMKGARATQHSFPGEFRYTQNWIGGTSPSNARYVPPPPNEVSRAMGDIEKFMHAKDEYPPLIKAALLHAQFETIHPFLDGNGRLGRLLITFYLCWKRVMQKPLLYLSYYFKLHRQEYYDRLNLVREQGDYEQWIAFFLKGVIWTSESALEMIKKVLALADTHKKLLLQNKISSPLAIALLDHLFAKPHLSIQEIAEHFQTSFQTAQTLVSQFVKLGILKEITGRKRDRRFSYWEYLDLLSEGTNFYV